MGGSKVRLLGGQSDAGQHWGVCRGVAAAIRLRNRREEPKAERSGPGRPRILPSLALPGRYVVFSKAVDGTQIQIADNCQLDGKVDGDVSYAVFRVDPDNESSIDYVISQRVATLLTQLTNDQKNRPAGMLETSLGYLTDTLKAYTNFTDLQRYQDLLAKGTSRTSAESDQMTKLESRSDLQPFLKPLKASQTT